MPSQTLTNNIWYYEEIFETVDSLIGIHMHLILIDQLKTWHWLVLCINELWWPTWHHWLRHRNQEDFAKCWHLASAARNKKCNFQPISCNISVTEQDRKLHTRFRLVANQWPWMSLNSHYVAYSLSLHTLSEPVTKLDRPIVVKFRVMWSEMFI